MPPLPADIIEAMTSPLWWGPWFADGDWSRWHAHLKAVFALPMTDADLAIYRDCTGRGDPPSTRAPEAYADVGRRGGKTRTMATVAAWLAAFEDWRPFLAPGESAHVLLIAKDTTQAGVAFRYLASLFLDHSVLRDLVAAKTADSLTLHNGVIVRAAAASFRGLRGYAIAALLADELAYWFDGETSANPAEEILAAVRPGMLQFGGRAMLLCSSSPYRRTGPLWTAYRAHYGKPSPILFWKAPTITMNPLASAEEIARAYEEDPQKAMAEYGAEFRQDIAAFVDREAVEAVVAVGRRELPPAGGTSYFAFVDPSGGSSDSMTLAIGHTDRHGCPVLDCLREAKPPFSPEAVCAEFAETLRAYRVTRVVGDRWGGEWPREQFRKRGIAYAVSEKTKSDLYREMLPLLNSGRVELLDLPPMIGQFAALERRNTRGGRDSIDHPIGVHDDLANVVAGALVLAASASVPALWRNDALLVEDAPVAWPRRTDGVFASVMADESGVAILYWACDRNFGGPPLTLIDFDQQAFSPGLFAAIRDRVHTEARAAHALPGLFTSVALAAQISTEFGAEMLNFFTAGDLAGARAIDLTVEGCADQLLRDREALLLLAAAQIGTGRVKIAAPAHTRSMSHPSPLSDLSPGAPTTAATDAALVAIGSTIDPKALPWAAGRIG
jgi:hypothetical protein